MTDKDDRRRDRKSRKRGSDDGLLQDGGWPVPTGPSFGTSTTPWPTQAASSGSEFDGVVRRFDAERGFGFVALDGATGDAFLHISALQRAGADTVTPGTRLRVRVGQGQKGPQVVEVVEVGAMSDEPSPPGPGLPRAFRDASQAGDGHEVQGTVKRYSAEKGFGFI